jgi:hypothetical protein
MFLTALANRPMKSLTQSLHVSTYQAHAAPWVHPRNLASAIGAKLFWRGHVMFLLKETIRLLKLAFLTSHN